MKITETEVRKVADLANLHLTETETARLAQDLDKILDHMDRLSEIPTEGIEPMAQVLYDAPETATLRADVVRPPLGSVVALANAPLSGPGFFKVPSVMERS